jgi:hypothetical protein
MMEMELFMKRLSLSTMLLGTCLVVIPLASASVKAQDATGATIIKPAETKPVVFNQGALFPHTLLDRALLKAVNTTGEVSYSDLKGNADLDLYIQALATADLTRFPVLTKKDVKTGKPYEDRNFELAFWINAHNARVLKSIADVYPISNVSEIKDFETAKTHQVAGQMWSLRDIREKVAKMEPRALFALTDGTRGGPMIAPTAYRYSTINSSLERAVRNFVSDPRNVTLTRIQNKVALSEYFKNVNEYFSKKNDRKRFDGVRALLAVYSERGGDRNYFTTSDYIIDFMPASRALNTKSR